MRTLSGRLPLHLQLLGLLTAFSAPCRLEYTSRLPLRRSDRRRVLAVLVSLQLVPEPPYRA